MNYEPRHCEICGALIPVTKHEGMIRYSTRKTCRHIDQAHLPKNEHCAYKQNYRHRKKNINIKPQGKAKGKREVIATKRTLTDAQIAELDRQQREIDRAIFERNLDQYTTLPGRILSEEERRELEGVYLPPVKEYLVLPHFRLTNCA